MKVQSYFATHIGLVRDENQDSVFSHPETRLFIVADGMGGHQGGKVASQMAIKILSEKLLPSLSQKTPSSDLPQALQEAYQEANQTIYNEGQKQEHLRGMGTTVCLFLVREDGTAFIGNVGDSRCYMRGESPPHPLWQLTEDHTFATNQLKISLMTGDTHTASDKNKETSPSLKEDHILTKSVGFTPTVEPDLLKRQVRAGEVYLLCSDGLTGMIPNKKIEHIMNTQKVENIPQECVDEALKAGGLDNIAVVAVKILP